MFIVTFQNPFSDYLGLCLLHCGPGIRIQRFVTDIFTPSGLKRPLHLLWPQGNSLKGIDNKFKAVEVGNFMAALSVYTCTH